MCWCYELVGNTTRLLFKNSVYLARSSSTSDLLRALCRKQRSSHRPGVEVKTKNKKQGVQGLRALNWNTFHLPWEPLVHSWGLYWDGFNHVSSGVAWGLSESRPGASMPSIWHSSWDSFSSLKYLSYHRAQNCKKNKKTKQKSTWNNLDMTSIEYSPRCHLMFQ